jgi:predicted RNA-binding Zn-ribbon protein involved in translation (DUF1610 family)
MNTFKQIAEKLLRRKRQPPTCVYCGGPLTAHEITWADNTCHDCYAFIKSEGASVPKLPVVIGETRDEKEKRLNEMVERLCSAVVEEGKKNGWPCPDCGKRLVGNGDTAMDCVCRFSPCPDCGKPVSRGWDALSGNEVYDCPGCGWESDLWGKTWRHGWERPGWQTGRGELAPGWHRADPEADPELGHDNDA